MALKTGSMVQLKSGGPEMTVHGVIGDKKNPLNNSLEYDLKMGGNDNGDVYCQWFDDKNKLASACFKPQMLDEVNEED
jgi:uncharacterized protein YodC (DUF2158 family)